MTVEFVRDVKEKLHEQGTDVDIVVDQINVINKGFENKPQIDVDALIDYDQMKKKLVTEVVCAETNKEMLAKVPHKRIEDMAIVYHFVLTKSDDTERASILATNQMIANMGVTPEQLHADAIENAPRIKPAEIRGMSEILAELLGADQAAIVGISPVKPEEANKIGYETAMRWTKGEHVFLVATHIDRAHIHNHIIYNSTALSCDRKFRNFWFSRVALQKVSDLVCLENGLSVIEGKRSLSTKRPGRHSPGSRVSCQRSET